MPILCPTTFSHRWPAWPGSSSLRRKHFSIVNCTCTYSIRSTSCRPGVAFSPLSKMAYMVNEGDGTLVVIDGKGPGIVARVQAEPGLGQIRFAPGGRLGFVVNPEKDLVHILDVVTNSIVQTGDVEDGPDQSAFSKDLAYIRHAATRHLSTTCTSSAPRSGSG